MKCIVCGKTTKHFIKLEHGSIPICNELRECRDLLNFKVNYESYPILFVGKDEFIEHDLETYIDDLPDKDVISLAKDVRDYALGDSFWEGWSEALINTHEELEHDLIEKKPLEDLPLMIGHLEYERNEKVLEQRLKEESK